MKVYWINLLICLLFISIGVSAQQSSSSDTTKATSEIFSQVDAEASFPGEGKGWKEFLQKNLNPNTPVDNNAPVGRYIVKVQFTVEIDGSLSDIKPMTNLGYGLEKEVLRIIRKSGSWIPAIRDGKPVRAYRLQPVVFITEEDGFEINCKTPYILYTDTDNEITIEVRKVPGDNLKATISEGTITALGEGKFIARVSKPGRALIEVFKKNNKKISTASFDVQVPGANKNPL